MFVYLCLLVLSVWSHFVQILFLSFFQRPRRRRGRRRRCRRDVVFVVMIDLLIDQSVLSCVILVWLAPSCLDLVFHPEPASLSRVSCCAKRNSIDREDLIICIAIWTLYKLRPPLVCDEFRAVSIALQNKLRFTSLLGHIFKDFGRPNGFPNSIFEAFFLMLFFIAFEHPILVNFSRLRTRKIMIFLKENDDFYKNCVFDKNTQIAWFWLRFRKPKRRKSVQNSNPKTCCFEASNLKGFSSNFRCILESKNHQKIANFRKNWCSKASSLALFL